MPSNGRGSPKEQKVDSTLSRFQRWAKRLVEAGLGQKRSEITVETDRVLIIRRWQVTRAWCSECGGEVEMVSLADIASIVSNPLHVQSDAAPQGWHFGQRHDGTPLVCLESVLRSM